MSMYIKYFSKFAKNKRHNIRMAIVYRNHDNRYKLVQIQFGRDLQSKAIHPVCR